MKVQFARPHPPSGMFASAQTDTKVVELPDDTNGEPTPVPEGGTVVDPATPVQDWTPSAATSGFPAFVQKGS